MSEEREQSMVYSAEDDREVRTMLAAMPRAGSKGVSVGLGMENPESGSRHQPNP